MDTDRLARVLHHLGDTTPRRAIVTLLAAGAVSFGLQDPAEGGRRKKRKRKSKRKKRCENGTVRCGETCITGACCAGQVCPGDCQCTHTIDGAEFCKPSDQQLATICMLVMCPPCVTSSDCPAGFRCVKDATFGVSPICQPPCGFERQV